MANYSSNTVLKSNLNVTAVEALNWGLKEERMICPSPFFSHTSAACFFSNSSFSAIPAYQNIIFSKRANHPAVHIKVRDRGSEYRCSPVKNTAVHGASPRLAGGRSRRCDPEQRARNVQTFGGKIFPCIAYRKLKLLFVVVFPNG
jgi:hypothetical protein